MEFSRPEYWSEWLFLSSGDLPNPGIKLKFPVLQVGSLPAEPHGKPKNTGVGAYPFSSRSSRPRNPTGGSCITGGFFTSWAICCYWVASVVSYSVRPHRRQAPRLHHPWDSPGKNTGVGCHFLLQCIKVKSESEVAQSCPTLSDPTDCTLPVSCVHGILQARVLEWVAIALLLAELSG